MSDQDDDLFGGEGLPTDEEILRVSAYLRRHNREYGARPTQRELEARGFTVALSRVQRRMAGHVKTQAAKDVVAAVATERVRQERQRNRIANPPEEERPPISPEQATVTPEMVSKMADLLITANTSTMLAIQENRTRMALNIVIAEALASRPELILLDMRGAAALVDALTCGTKLSGGHTIDVRIPTDAERLAAQLNPDVSPTGNVMKNITPAPQSPLIAQLARFRNERRANGKGT